MKTADFRALARFSQEKMQKNEIFSTKRMTADVYCLEPGQAQRAHKHEEEDKVYFVLEGTGRFTIGRSTRELHAGTSVLAAAGEEHGVVNMAEDRLMMIVVTAPPATMKT